MTERGAPYARRRVVPLLYAVFVLVPIYWLIIISFMTQEEATAGLSFFPKEPTLNNYLYILTDRGWALGFVNAGIYTILNVILSLTVAVPAAYAFSRYSFLGDKHLFFWFLASRMTPSAVLFLPLLQLYSEIGLMDRVVGVALAHCLFTVPVAVWILEGFFRQIPVELDETSRVDGRGRVAFALKVLLPVAAHYDIHPAHLGIIFLATMQLGYLTPPVGLNLFIASYRFNKPIMHVYSATFPFLIILMLSVILITFLPELSLLFVSGD